MNRGIKERVPELTRSQYAFRALDWIFAYPIFTSTHFVQDAGIPEPTARRFLRALREGEILRLVGPGRGRRAGMLIFPAFLNVVEGRRSILTIIGDRQRYLSITFSRK